jgi:hypothetical protein
MIVAVCAASRSRASRRHRPATAPRDACGAGLPRLPIERRLQRVGLPEQQVFVIDARDRAVVVQEGVAAALVDVLERVTELGVRHAVTVVVDVDQVRGVGRERVEVRAAVRALERDEVGDECDVAGPVRADEGVQVGVVDRRVEAISGASRWLEATELPGPSAEMAATIATAATITMGFLMPRLRCRGRR